MIKICDCCGDSFKRDDRTILTIKVPKCGGRGFMEEDLVLCPVCRDETLRKLRELGYYDRFSFEQLTNELIKKNF